MKQIFSISLLVAAIIVIMACLGIAFDLPKWFPFNNKYAIQEWEEKVFRGKVLYSVSDEDNEGYLSANSDKACSGLFYKMKFNVREYPNIRWQWKVSQFPDKTKKTDKKGWVEKDDYAARVYVIFASWNFFNTKSLEYIWDETLPVETVKISPYIDNIRLIVAESGKENMDKWVAEERNIFEDYQKAFGKKPPKYASAIALMTDADNTMSTAEAFYRNLKVGFQPQSLP